MGGAILYACARLSTCLFISDHCIQKVPFDHYKQFLGATSSTLGMANKISHTQPPLFYPSPLPQPFTIVIPGRVLLNEGEVFLIVEKKKKKKVRVAHRMYSQIMPPFPYLLALFHCTICTILSTSHLISLHLISLLPCLFLLCCLLFS